MTASGVAEPLHFKKADLVETAGKDIDGMTVVGSSLGKVIIKLIHKLASYANHGAIVLHTFNAFL